MTYKKGFFDSLRGIKIFNPCYGPGLVLEVVRSVHSASVEVRVFYTGINGYQISRYDDACGIKSVLEDLLKYNHLMDKKLFRLAYGL